MKQTIFTTIFFIFMGTGFCESAIELERGCKKFEKPHIFPVHYGWPYKIQCSFILEIKEAMDLYDSYEYEYWSEENIECLISNSVGRSLLNETTSLNRLLNDDVYYYLSDITNETDLNYFITLKLLQSKECNSFSVSLNVSQLQDVSCQDFVRQELQRKRLFSSDVGGPKQFSCITGFGEHPGVFVDYDAPNTTIQWQRNCSDLPRGATVNEYNQMTIPSLAFDHAGVYVCSVTHNGMTRYVLAHDVCLTHPATYNKPIISCAQDHYHGQIGGNVTMRCTLTMGEGNFDHAIPGILWYKNNQTTKVKRCEKKSLLHSFEKSICFYTTEGSRECMRHIATKEERSPSTYSIHITIEILNLQLQDFTSYNLKIPYYHEDSSAVNATIYVSESLDTSEHTNSTLVLAIALISIGIAAVIIMLIVFIYKKRSKRLLF